mmetsp:Transcript_1225/g.4061  ORF Transcript_1225/g.4061 Transcript_1225/m.4061 type:complete len:483 (+) Transcript_1225:124-1572(+)|eukprot:CAMPEP_0183789712 /NCGR_PEP_ID=MMETSP0803_2-20130417/591_1 /TAXON_ID=195967 /ORGANISM="Crustomastix stigmata, Strain CCMP3273" /LENGTH=482 /DNA_ID=CAMNT_0026033891 /DNA_START=107 /DNA_END=1555 /DNA_ORIENTATION=-
MAEEQVAAAANGSEKEEKGAGVKKVPGERLVRLEKPDRAAHEASLNKLQAALDRYNARINTIKDTIDQKRESRKQVSSGSALTRSRMSELSAAIKGRMDERQTIREELLVVDAARERLREESRTIRDGLPYSRVEDINAEISRLEDSIQHTTMTLNEEKRLMQRIKDLSRSREQVRQYHERLGKITEEEQYRKGIIERIRAKDQEINALKAEQAELRKLLDSARNKEEAEVADVPSLSAERNKCAELLRETRSQIRTMRVEFKAKEDEYYQRERELRAQMNEEKKRRWEEAQEERKRRAEERKKRDLENAVEPYTEEVVMCEQLAAYLGKYVEDEASTSAPAKDEEAEAKATEAMAGLKLIGKKSMDAGAGVSKGKKGKKGKGGGGDSKPSVVKLVHSLDTLASFTRVGLTPPPTSAGAKETIEELARQKEHYLAKREVKKAQLAAQLAAMENGEGGGDGPVGVTLTANGKSVKLELKVSDE